MTLAMMGVGLLVLALIGVMVASDNLATLAAMAVFGAGAGLFLGTSASWSGDRDVRASDAARFAGGGLATVFALTGAGALDGILPPLALLAMLVGGWLLHEYVRDSGAPVAPSSGSRARATRRLPQVPERCDSLPVTRLHELWELLCLDDSRSGGEAEQEPLGPADPRVVELRSRVLDALARCDPEGYATWLRTDAPRNVAAHVGNRRPGSGDARPGPGPE
ncbi:MAG: hypothetical protein WCA29_11010 [Jiangellales bacterium]